MSLYVMVVQLSFRIHYQTTTQYACKISHWSFSLSVKTSNSLPPNRQCAYIIASRLHISVKTNVGGHLCVSMWFCGILRVVHYTTEIMVQTVLFVQLNSNTLFHMPVIRFSSLRWDMAVQEWMCGKAPLPCAQQLAHCTTSKMIYDHQGGEPERACIVDLMFCHGTQIITAGFVAVCCSMTMVSKTSCSHFACHRSYYATHTLGLNFTIKSRAESLALMSVIMHGLTWSKRNYCAWFDGTVCEQPALVCHGSQSRRGVASSPNMNLF